MDGAPITQSLQPSSSNTNPPFVWVPSSTTRGTFQIFTLCATTTVICIWSSVHRDIPYRRLSTFRSLPREAAWVLVAFFFPEFLLLFAMNQTSTARRLVKEIRIKRQRQYPFTLVHGFYAVMGGYVFDVGSSGDNEEDDGGGNNGTRARMTITPNGFLFLLERDPFLIPNLSVKSITDRSKSSNLGKALLVLQLTWFFANCISRLKERLPLTLLEVTTAAHGIITLASYAAWWYKPLNIDEPTLIGGEQAEEVFALMRMAYSDRESLPLRAVERYGLSDTDLRRIDFHAFLSSGSEPSPPKSIAEIIHFLIEYINDLKLSSYSSTTYSDIVILPAVYGCMHFFGWHAQFPTPVEQKLWRIATVAVCSSGGVSLVVFVLTGIIESCYSRIRAINIIAHSLTLVGVFLVTIFIPCLYLFGILYLLVESLRQLFYLPPKAFDIGSWSNYFPHIS
ncbi:hypothetical protein SCHPADRAFT_825899 [Schizopora paradoxa]|uniref:Uncharacterized protein n=1 Tax=Schizopora paradoxa TaxID=27342 RepID=A0A0H2RYY5_9AGAM|nr:hypothetical protein SCHPADRAFT_825899 [Schizopora paradoxa]